MKNMSAWAIRNPTLPLVAFLVLTFLGIVSFIRLPINLNPDISFPLIIVQVSQPGAAPPEIETQITQKVEGAVRGVSGVRTISSRASEGGSFTSVEFEIGTPVDRALSDVRDAVSKVRSELPEGVDEPQVSRVDVEGGAIAYYAVGTTGRTRSISSCACSTSTRRAAARRWAAANSRSACSDRRVRPWRSAPPRSASRAARWCGCPTSPRSATRSPNGARSSG
jgi:multidrug efflux pump subunit AcrB